MNHVSAGFEGWTPHNNLPQSPRTFGLCLGFCALILVPCCSILHCNHVRIQFIVLFKQICCVTGLSMRKIASDQINFDARVGTLCNCCILLCRFRIKNLGSFQTACPMRIYYIHVSDILFFLSLVTFEHCGWRILNK